MDIYQAQRLIGEDVIATMGERFRLLESVKLGQPIGRRKLTTLLALPERKVRAHLEYLSRKKLILSDSRGVMLNPDIEDVTPFLLDFFVGFNASLERETSLASSLGIQRVLCAPGNSGTDATALSNMGLLASGVFMEKLSRNSLVAVSGGSSLKAFCDSLPTVERRGCMVIPVRGAIGSSHSFQSNTIALLSGIKLSCNALSLPIPDNVDQDLVQTLGRHPDILAVTSHYPKIDLLVFGISQASSMLAIRTLPESQKSSLLDSGAVAEAVGYYFAKSGKIISKASGLGLSQEDLARIPVKIAIAGSAGKAEAVAAVCRAMPDLILVTDESCAGQLESKRFTPDRHHSQKEQ